MVKKCMKCGGTMKKGGPVKQVQPGGVPPPPSRSQYRSQIENKYKSKYYTKDGIYIGNPKRKKQVDVLIEKQTNDSMRNRDNSIKNKKVPAKKIMAKGGSVGAGIPYRSGAGQTDGKNGMMKKGGTVKKMQNGGTTATRGKTKYEYGNTPYPGPNQIFVNKTKTKRSGKTVATNATNELTNSGFKTTIKKTITDKSGNSKTKDIKGTMSNFDKLFRKGQRATELERKKPKAMYGASVKPKMMQKSGTVNKMAKGGSLKSVPASKVGLAKLPTAVRNKMGYKKTGGPVKKKK